MSLKLFLFRIKKKQNFEKPNFSSVNVFFYLLTLKLTNKVLFLVTKSRCHSPISCVEVTAIILCASIAEVRVQNFGEREQLARSLAQKFRNPSSRSLARVKIQEGQLALARSRKNRSSLAGLARSRG
jgi:hypothetical protein